MCLNVDVGAASDDVLYSLARSGVAHVRWSPDSVLYVEPVMLSATILPSNTWNILTSYKIQTRKNTIVHYCLQNKAIHDLEQILRKDVL